MGRKQDLIYATGSVALVPFLYLSLSHSSNKGSPKTLVLVNHEIPYDAVLFIGLSEILKVFLARLFSPPTKFTVFVDSSSLYRNMKNSRLPSIWKDNVVDEGTTLLKVNSLHLSLQLQLVMPLLCT